MDIQTILVNRLTIAAAAVILSLLSLILLTFIRRGKGGIVTSVFAALGVLGSLNLLRSPLQSLLDGNDSLTVALTVRAPLIILAAAAAAHFILLIVFAKKYVKKLPVNSSLWAVLAAALQFALTAFNFLSHLDLNLGGQPELVPFNVILVILPVLPPIFFFIGYLKGRKALKTA
jgi:hypothetical protein